MANEYLVNSSDLTSVANAIRTKGDTSAQLVFPSGFVTAIEDIEGGGAELNFEIVGGTSTPVSPKENTIWVNTSTTITSWAFSAEEPDSPVSGMVWFKTGEKGAIKFDAISDDNILMIHLISSSQYNDGEWEYVYAKLYNAENWTELFDGYVFKDGISYIGGGWQSDISGDYITQKINIPSSASSIYTHNTPIDVSGYKTATFVIQSSSPIYTNTEVGIYSQSGYGSNISAIAYKRSDSYSPNTDTSFIVDIPSGVSQCYLGFGVNRQGSGGSTTTLKVRSILLE